MPGKTSEVVTKRTFIISCLQEQLRDLLNAVRSLVVLGVLVVLRRVAVRSVLVSDSLFSTGAL